MFEQHGRKVYTFIEMIQLMNESDQARHFALLPEECNSYSSKYESYLDWEEAGNLDIDNCVTFSEFRECLDIQHPKSSCYHFGEFPLHYITEGLYVEYRIEEISGEEDEYVYKLV